MLRCKAWRKIRDWTPYSPAKFQHGLLCGGDIDAVCQGRHHQAWPVSQVLVGIPADALQSLPDQAVEPQVKSRFTTE